MSILPENPPSSRMALRRVLIVLAIVVGLGIYAYGWQVTDISLAPTQDQTRQDSVQRALRELFSPDIFDQDRDTQTANASFQVTCSGQPVQQVAPTSGQPHITVSPDCGATDDFITVEGFDYHPDAVVAIRWTPAGGQPRTQGRADADGSGHFMTQIPVPRVRASSNTLALVAGDGSWAIGSPRLSDGAKDVLAKMVETVLMALMATTISLPISVFVSFLAAKNLMHPIRIPLGTVMIGLLLLPVGWLLGSQLLGPIGKLGTNLANGVPIFAPTAGILLFAAASGAQAIERFMTNNLSARVRKIGRNLLILIAVIFALGILGGIAIGLGHLLSTGFLAVVGNLLGTLGMLVDLTIVALAGFGGGVLLASVGMALALEPVRRLPDVEDKVVGGILGALSGGLLLLVASQVGATASLLTLLPPLVAALLGPRLFLQIYDRASGDHRNGAARVLVGFVGAALTFAAAFALLNTLRPLVDGIPPSTVSTSLTIFGSVFSIQTYILVAVAIGAVLGGVAGALAGMQASVPFGDVIYNFTRTILNALRSIEPLIMGIVFVIWVGIGPFAGVLALTLHSIASLGKLFSEQIESIDPGPIEAIQATGATRLQTIIYAVVPQIVPPYISFTMYRWDINVRMSTIIGFVGGGGIGFLLQQQINLLRYREAGVAVLAIAVVVSVLDYASAAIRERFV